MNPLTDAVCRWSAPGGAGSIYLSAGTVRDLRAKAIQAFLSLPRRGVETGGLLFGSDHPDQLFIHGFEEIPCEHRYGPSFTLSDEERTRLTEKLTQLQGNGAPSVIGLYRSYTGRGPEVDPADLELLREHFPKGQFVFLLLQPVNAQACAAGFRLCQDGELLDDPAFAAVPFDPEYFNCDAESVVEPDPEPSRAPIAAGKPLTLPPPYRSFSATTAVAPALAAPEPPRAKMRWWLPVLLCLLGGIAGASLYELWTLSRQPRWAELYLDAIPSPDARSLVVTWDAAASKSVAATHALLGVNDGDVHRDIPLTQAQLQLGRYLYTPGSANLELRLVLYGNGPAVSGSSLRIAGLPLPAAPPTPAAEPPKPAAAAAAPVVPVPAPAPPESTGERASVREVQPDIPAGIRARLSRDMEIPVIVRVNARGIVTSASTSPVGDGLRRYLAQEAVKAARQWRFAPARKPSERTLYFSFAP